MSSNHRYHTNSEFANTQAIIPTGTILFLTDSYSQTWHIPVPNLQIEYFHVEKGQVPTIVPQLLLASCGYATWQDPIQQYICQMHQRGIPVIMFPYGNKLGSNECKLIRHVHALQGGQQTCADGVMADNTLVPKIPHHPILYQVQTFECNSVGRIAAKPMEDAIVVATWIDGVPLIAERGTIVSLNFCPYNVKVNCDAMTMIRNCILYLLDKVQAHISMQRIRAYRDVKFVF